MSGKSNGSEVVAFLKNHPRLLGVLFALLVVLSQVGAVTADMCATCSGP